MSAAVMRPTEAGLEKRGSVYIWDMSDTVFDYKDILEILPHRYPFLLVDRVLEFESGKRAVGLKNVSFGEPYFNGHFPGEPVMPGVLQVEAIAQVATILILKSFPEMQGKRPAFMGIDKARFRRAIRPGDALHITVELLGMRRGVATVKGEITVDDVRACDAEIMATLV